MPSLQLSARLIKTCSAVASAITLVGTALPYLRDSRGTVVNVSSILSVIPSVDDMSYWCVPQCYVTDCRSRCNETNA